MHNTNRQKLSTTKAFILYPSYKLSIHDFLFPFVYLIERVPKLIRTLNKKYRFLYYCFVFN